MKTVLSIVITVLIAFSQTLHAQTADDYVATGRAFLQATNIVAANGRFASALALSPNHQVANAFYAITRLLVLPYETTGSAFLDQMGVPAAGRNIYEWTAIPPTDTNDVPLAPVGVKANEFTALLRTNILSEIIAAEANLAQITDVNFTLNLTSSETRTTDVTVDYGDIQLLRAMLLAGEYFIYTTYSWNLDAQLSALRSVYVHDGLTIQELLIQHPNLLTFATTNDLNAAKLAFQNGASRYSAASQFIRNRPGGTLRLFNLDPGQAEREERFRLTLTNLNDSLVGAVTVTVETNYLVFFGTQFGGEHSVRSFLPEFSGSGFVLGTLPDTSFGGLISGLTRGDIEEALARFLIPVPSLQNSFAMSEGQFQFPLNVVRGRGYVVQVSTNLTDWTDYVAFAGFSDTHTFIDNHAGDFAGRFYRLVDRTDDMPPPANDDFANRIPLTGLGIMAFGYAANSSIEPDEPNPWDGSSWWSWTSPVSGSVIVSLNGSRGYAYANIYTGNSLQNLNWIAYEFEPFEAVAGTTYQIQVFGDMWSAPPGGIKLTIAGAPTIIISSPVNGEVFAVPTNVFICASASDISGSINRLKFYGDEELLATTTNDSFSLTWSNVPSGWHYVDVSAENFSGIKTWEEVYFRIPPANDNFADRILIPGTSATIEGSNDGASRETDEPLVAEYGGGSVWWSWTAPSNGVCNITVDMISPWGYYENPAVGVYTGDSVSELTEVASDIGLYGNSVHLSFPVVAGVTYHISVDEYYGDTGDISLLLHYAPPPTNDNFADRALISGLNIPVASHTDGASLEVEETFYSNGHTVWWTWTAAESAEVAVVASGGDDCWPIGVFTGTSLDDLTFVASDNNDVRFFAEAGVTYQIAVDSCSEDGPVNVVITHPPTVTISSPDNGADFETPADVLIECSASDLDGQITYMTIELNDYYGGNSFYTETTNDNFSLLWEDAPNGYYDLYVTATDNVGCSAWDYRAFRIKPSNDDFANASPINDASEEIFAFGSNTGASKEPGEPYHAGNYGGGSVWWSWTAPSNGIFNVSATLYNKYPLLGIYTGESVSNLTEVAASFDYYATQVSFMANAGITYHLAVDEYYGDGGLITLVLGYLRPPSPLTIGTATNNISGLVDSQTFFKVTVPDGTASLQINISGGTGDCDLYVRFGSLPTLSIWDYRPYLDGNNETVTIPNPATGDWFIMLHGYNSYSGLTLLAQ